MTKEELEKEAVEYTDSAEEKKHWSDENDSNAVFTREEVEQAYLAGAEPREKRIADLERKLEQTEKDLTDYQFNYPKIKDLEKQIEKMKCCENCKHSNTTCECYTICTIGHYDDCKSNTVLDSLDKKDYWEN